MVSKGLTLYSYVSVAGVHVEFSVPKESIINTAEDNWTVKKLEVESKNIQGERNFVGRFTWRVVRDGATLAERWNDINSLTGKLKEGNMVATMHTPSLILHDMIISYGFYDAGSGRAGLTNRNQCYVVVTSNHSNWMGIVAPLGSAAEALPFSRFALPAAHDEGMNSMQNSDAVIDDLSQEKIIKLVDMLPKLTWFSNLMSEEVLHHILPDIVEGLAVTQKDSVTTMLAIGARYFEFRPAHIHADLREESPLPHKLYFQHACIPGMAYDEFLDEVLTFLTRNPTEIVVVHLRWDGVLAGCAKPDDEELAAVLEERMRATNCQVTVGDVADLEGTTIRDLRHANRRLIILKPVDVYSSYSPQANGTLNSETIVAAFEKMTTEGQTSSPITNLQCQATAQDIKEVVVYSVLAANTSNSCISSTKAAGDQITLPWIRDNAASRLTADKIMVIMNDFIDGCTVETAIDVSQQRFNVTGPAPDGGFASVTNRLFGTHINQ